MQTLGANVLIVRRSKWLRQSWPTGLQAGDLRKCGDGRRLVAPVRFPDPTEPGRFVAYVSFAVSLRPAHHGTGGRGLGVLRADTLRPGEGDDRGRGGPIAAQGEGPGRVGSVFVA